MEPSTTLYGHTARLVLTIDGRDVDVSGGLRWNGHKCLEVDHRAVLNTLMHLPATG